MFCPECRNEFQYLRHGAFCPVCLKLYKRIFYGTTKSQSVGYPTTHQLSSRRIPKDSSRDSESTTGREN